MKEEYTYKPGMFGKDNSGPRMITASPETMADQAGWCVEIWLQQAHQAIDGVFGEGYARKHPELVGNYLIAVANENAANTLATHNLEAGNRIAEALHCLERAE